MNTETTLDQVTEQAVESVEQPARPVKLTLVELTARIYELEDTVRQLTARLEAPAAPKEAGKGMTEEHARAVLYGEEASLGHKDAAAKFGLTYGQVYSCRIGATFKPIHQEMKVAGKPNRWIKA